MPNPELGKILLNNVQALVKVQPDGRQPTVTQALEVLRRLPRSTQEVLIDKQLKKMDNT